MTEENDEINMLLALRWYGLMRHIKHDTRFNLSGIERTFLEQIVQALESHSKVTIPEGTVLYRARFSPPRNDKKGLVKVPPSPEVHPLNQMGAPPPAINPGGRLHPPGMSFLYLADSVNTAVSELRPWRGARISVASFSLQAPLVIAGLSSSDVKSIEDAEMQTALRTVSTVLSVPHDPQDYGASAGTQLFASAIKSAGFSGIRYQSATDSAGSNVVLFNPAGALATKVEVHEVQSSKYVSKIL